MLKQDLIAALRKASGGAEFISQKELAQVLGFKDPHKKTGGEDDDSRAEDRENQRADQAV